MEFTKENIARIRQSCQECQWAADPNDLLLCLVEIERLQEENEKLKKKANKTPVITNIDSLNSTSDEEWSDYKERDCADY